MRILFDECVDERLRHFFHKHDCQTARFAGFSGLKSGALLVAAEAADFDIIVTVDQHIPEQHSLESRHVSLLILCNQTNRLLDLKSLVPAAIHALDSIKRGQVVSIQG